MLAVKFVDALYKNGLADQKSFNDFLPYQISRKHSRMSSKKYVMHIKVIHKPFYAISKEKGQRNMKKFN